jgi:hypothetical protein
MALSDVELFLNTIAHYFSGGTFLPNAFTQTRPTAFEHPNYKIITVGTQEDFERIPRDLLSAEQSLAPADVETLRWFFKNYPQDRVQALLPSRIPFKENLCVLVAELITELNVLPQNLSTTDALRVIVYLGDGDFTLTTKGEKLRRFPRDVRRELLAFLESLDLSVEEMQERRKRWLRVGEILHPGEYAGRYPKTFAAFQRLRNEKVRTWASAVETAATLDEKLDVLTRRPGEFARRLDSLVRGSESISALYRKNLARQGCGRMVLEKVARQARLQAFRAIVKNFARAASSAEIAGYAKFHDQISKEILQARQNAGQPKPDAFELAWRSWEIFWQDDAKRLARDRRAVAAEARRARRYAFFHKRKRLFAWETIRQTRIKPLSKAKLAKILTRFESVADKISPKVLYELYARFEKRREADAERTVFIKGARRPTSLIPLPALDAALVDRVQATLVDSIKRHYAPLPPLETCWIDPQLSRVPLPTNMRSISNAFVPTVRGARVPLGNKNAKVVRFYVHWFDADGDVDLDLSATFVGKDAVDFVSWNQGLNKSYGVHSGDVRHRQGHCAEYVDIVVEEARQKFDYVVVDVRNYDGAPLAAVNPTCGYMEREAPESNSIWVPNTVAGSFKLSSPYQATLVAAIDLKTLEYIVLDVDAKSRVASCDLQTTLDLLRWTAELPKLSVADLLRWHIEARGGTEVAEKENAKTVFNALDFTKDYVKILKTMFPNE